MMEEKVPREPKEKALQASAVDVWYGDFQALKNVDLEMDRNKVTAFIGPSGCGKSTFLRLFNRMNDFIPSFKLGGNIMVGGQDIYRDEVRVEDLRKKVGMVFQKPNPFPKSIFENVAYGMKIQGIRDKEVLNGRVEEALIQSDLWGEVKGNLKKNAMTLSGGQQQRLCIARCLAVIPEVILMDEPTSALDPISTAKIEHLLFSLKEKYTIVIVTHNMQQAGRISDHTAFFYMGELIEYGKTKEIFTKPVHERTENYISGRFG